MYLENYHSKKNRNPHVKEYCTKNDALSLLIIPFFFSQTDVIFADILAVFATDCLHFYLLVLDIIRTFYILRTFSSSAHIPFFKKSVKFSDSKCFYNALFSMNPSYLLTMKTTPDIDNSLLLVHDVQDLHSSLHVRRNFWFLIMVLTKLKYYVYARSYFCKQIFKKNIYDC